MNNPSPNPAGEAGASTLSGPPQDQLTGSLAAILDQARQVVERLGSDPLLEELADHNHYDFMREKLPDLAAFEEFSLAEYTYNLKDGRSPGIRIRYAHPGGLAVCSVVMFDQVGIWDVDEAGRLLCHVLLTLSLQGDEPRAVGGELFSGPGFDPSDWRAWLARALSAPLTGM